MRRVAMAVSCPCSSRRDRVVHSGWGWCRWKSDGPQTRTPPHSTPQFHPGAARSPPPHQPPPGHDYSADDKDRQITEHIRQQIAEHWKSSTSSVTREARYLTMAITAHKGMLWGCGLVVAVGTILYFFKEPLKADTVTQTADVAKRVISERKVQEEALEATKTIVSQILQDKPSLDLLVGLLKNLLSMKETKDNIASLLVDLFRDPYTNENTKIFLKNLFSDDYLLDQVLSLVNVGIHQLAQDAALKEQAIDFLTQVLVATLTDEQVQCTAGDALFYAGLKSIGLSASASRYKTHEESRLEDENKRLAQSLRDTRLDIARMQAALASMKVDNE
ncbi:hypothetical protein DIPPA_01792 [Diplonema papillatum]|nr:hypothetical protein DIPPA_01792 [Diplonema papillatum]